MAKSGDIFHTKKVSSNKPLFKANKIEKRGSIFSENKKESQIFGKRSKAPSPTPYSSVAVEKKAPAALQERIDPLETLNDEQYKAAVVELGRNLIIASAGTGKTSTIIGRVSFLLSIGVSPKEILLLTFTSKAAKEMLERIERTFGEQVSKSIQIGTFHSISLKSVRAMKPSYTLKLPKEAALLFRSIYEHRKILVEEVQPYSASTVYEKYGAYLNTTDRSDSFANWFSQNNKDQEVYADVYAHICEEFEEIKKKELFYDFNDLLIIMNEFYKKNRCPYREIIIDEYQDTNILQSLMISSMNPDGLYCVGDYDQSIYAFNGADINIIGGFAETQKNAKVSTLYKNYRSSASILALAETVIKNNARLYPKKIEVMLKGSWSPPKLVRPSDQQTQYLGVADTIKKTGDWSSTAVIYRSNSSGDGVEMILREMEIPCIRKGGPSFFESKEIASFISFYRLMAGDSSLPVFLQALQISPLKISIAQLIHSAYRIFGAGSVCNGVVRPDIALKDKAMPNKIENHQMGVVNYKKDPSRAHLSALSLSSKFKAHPITEYEVLSQSMAIYIDMLHSAVEECKGITSPAQMVKSLLASPLIRATFKHYASSFSKDSSGAIVPALLENNLNKITKKCEVILKIASKKKTHDAFIREVSVKQDQDEDSNAVQLLSVHASKGLEFSSVHIIDMIEDTFPNTKLMNNGGGGIDEERRLFYVAVTRAKHSLTLYSPIQAKKKTAKPSRFLYEGGLIQGE